MKRVLDLNTIVAQCTPSGSGALALLRISGPHAFTLVEETSILASGKKISDLPSHTVHYGRVHDEHKNNIDQVLFILMRGPHTFTGEDTIEITCHNNPFIIEAIIATLVKHGARVAQEGEFSRRAVLNNKIDLVQAEAINELILANTQHALKASLAQVEGSFSSFINKLERNLVKALAFSEASFEFIDDETLTFEHQIGEVIDQSLVSIATLKKAFNYQQQVREGIRIALVGSVNAGKSSLFNALLSKDRAIVTSVAGTTRDSIEAGLYRRGNFWTLIDTAGIRETHDIVEQQGIQRSMQEAQRADIVLLVYDSSRALSEAEEQVYNTLLTTHSPKIIVVHHKIDIAFEQPSLTTLPWVAVSSIEKRGLMELENLIEKKIEMLYSSMASPYLLNKRQYTLMMGLEDKLLTLKEMLQGTVAYELISHHLHDALTHISELTGKSISEQGMDAVFKEFCVGK